MNSAAILAQAVGIAYTAGLNVYATVALLGIGARLDWIPDLPGGLSVLSSPWVIGIAVALYALDFLATLAPGVASAWETIHSLIRPPAAAVLAAATAWHGDPLFVLLAALLGGGTAVTTHATKLGWRYAIDTSPEPVTNGMANATELALVATIALAVWQHPFIALAFAFTLLAAFILVVRFVWRVLRQVLSGHWTPGRDLRHEPRSGSGRVVIPDEDED